MTFTYKPELKLYIAEFRADKEFNIHIERPEPGYISMQQNSAEGGKYAAVDDWGTQNNDKLIIDYESGYFVTPKFIKIISKVEPTYAAITTDGDVVEIKAQEKSVELTANGTTEVTPDSGFAYLSKVSVKTNVPQSGEGGGGNTGGGIVLEYMRISDIEDMTIRFVAAAFALVVRVENGSGEVGLIGPYGLQNMGNLQGYEVKSIGLSIDVHSYLDGEHVTLRDMLTYQGLLETYNAIPRITEEEFYAL